MLCHPLASKIFFLLKDVKRKRVSPLDNNSLDGEEGDECETDLYKAPELEEE